MSICVISDLLSKIISLYNYVLFRLQHIGLSVIRLKTQLIIGRKNQFFLFAEIDYALNNYSNSMRAPLLQDSNSSRDAYQHDYQPLRNMSHELGYSKSDEPSEMQLTVLASPPRSFSSSLTVAIGVNASMLAQFPFDSEDLTLTVYDFCDARALFSLASANKYLNSLVNSNDTEQNAELHFSLNDRLYPRHVTLCD